MIRRYTYLFAGAAFALYAAVGAVAFAQPAPAAKGPSESVVRTTTDGQSHEVRIVRDASGRTTITRDGQATVIDPRQMAMDARRMALDAPRHGDTAEHLRNALQLRPNQETALAAYVKAMHPERTMIFRSDERDAATTPERLAQMERRLAEHDAAMRAYIQATRQFYDQLDPRQKAAFDELRLGDGPMGMMRQIRFVRMMPRMPPIPPIPPVPPAPAAPPPPTAPPHL